MSISTWGGLRIEFLFHPDLSSPDLNILFITGQKTTSTFVRRGGGKLNFFQGFGEATRPPPLRH